jgi:exodeoxyribonuclease VII large subunit
MHRLLMVRRNTVVHFGKRLQSPQRRIATLRQSLHVTTARLQTALQRREERARGRLQELATALHSLSPLAVLGRGYSLTRTVPEGKLVTDAVKLTPGDQLRLTFAKGEARVRVEEVTP